MDHTETIGHERADPSTRGINQLHQRLGQRESLRVVLTGLPGVEPDVLQQQDIAVGQAFCPGKCIGADDIASKLDMPTQLLAQHLRHRGQ